MKTDDSASVAADSALASRVLRAFHTNVVHRRTSQADGILEAALAAWARMPPEEDVKLFQSMGVLPSTYDSLTRVKIVQIMAVLNRVFGQVGDKSWGLFPSPDPTLPKDVQAAIVFKYATEGLKLAEMLGVKDDEQRAMFAANALTANEKQIEIDRQAYAKERAERMERVVDDIFEEADFTVGTIRRYIENLAKLGTAVIIGPCEEPTVQLKLRGAADTVEYKTEIDTALTFFVPSTMDVYPSPGATEAKDADLCIRMRYTKEALAHASASKNNGNGWRPEVIRDILKSYPGIYIGAQTMTDPVERAAQLGELPNTTRKYEAVRWFGLACGEELIELGISKDGIGDINPESYYEAEAIVMANRIIYARVCDPAVGRPVVKTTFYGDSSQFFGWPPALQIDNCQKLMNIAMAALKKQLQLSGLVPLLVNDAASFIDADRPGAFALNSGKVFLRGNNSFNQAGQTGPAIQPIQLPNLIREIIALFDTIARLADDASGFNRNMLGSGNFSGAARALADYEKVLTPNGPVKISQLAVGDEVFNTYSGVSKVTGVYPQGERPIIRMSFSNGEHVDCDPEHRWTVSTHPGRPTSWKTYTTQQLIDAGLFRKTIVGKKNPSGIRPKFALPYVESVGYAKREVPIDAYTLGALIGNGDARCRLCVLDQEVFDRIPYELGVADRRTCGKATTRTVKGVKHPYHSLGLGVHGLKKFIPETYLRNDKATRLELLRGLMDTDGCASENGDHVFYSTSSETLAHDFVELVRSLGATSVSLRSESGGEAVIRGRKIEREINYRICFNLDHERVFWLDRKQNRVHKRPRVRVYITGVELIGSHSATCITVDAKDSLFLCENYIPTHNTATGLMQIQEAASTIAMFVIGNIDATGIVPLLNKVVAWVNRNHKDKRVKGDPRIIAKGQLSKVMKASQQQVIAAGFQATQGGVMPQLLGPEKLMVALREYLKSIEFPNADKIIPDEERVKFLESMADAERSLQVMAAAQGGQPQQGQPGQGGAEQAPPQQAQPQQAQKEAGLGMPSGVEARRGAA